MSGVLAAVPTQTAYPNLPDFYDSQTLVVLPAGSDPVLDGVVESAWDSARSLEIVAFGASGNWVPGNGIRARALHNATTLFMLFEWSDASPDRRLDSWQLTDNTTAGGVWTRTGWGDDAMLVFFDNGTALDQNFSIQGCSGLCHTGAVQEMSTADGFVDLWKWSASRTDPFDYGEDMFLDNASQLTGSPTGGFHPDSPDSNANNTVVTAFGDRPAFVNSSVPASTSPTFVYDSAKTSLDWSTFSSTTLPNGTTVAGSVLAPGTGGRADLRTGAVHNGTAWTLEIARPFATGDNASRDMGIGDLNVPYYFGVAVLNNKTGMNHSTSGAPMKLVFAENALPDLGVRMILPQTPVLISDPANVTVLVHNYGFGDATGTVFVTIVDDTTALEVANTTAPAISWNQEYLVNLSFSSIGYLPGQHNFTAHVDTADSELESFEGNNSRAFKMTFVTTLAAPNIVIDAAVGPATAVFAGETFYINGSVTNQGPGDSVLDVTVRGFHPSFGTDDFNMGPLLANESANFSLSWDSTGIARGTYNFDVTVDPDNLIMETDESNSLPVQVAVDDRPDLVAPSLLADPASGLDGETILLNLTVRNTGSATAGPLAVWVYLDDGASTTPVNRSTIWNISVALGHGASQTSSFNWTIPVSLPVGPHLIRAWVDADNDFAEVSETNNNASVQIAVRAPPLPDLAPTVGSLDKASYRVGENGTATVTVTNVGVNYTGSVSLQIFDATANRTLGTVTVLPIAEGTSATFVVNFTLAAGSLGTHAVLALVDPEGVLDEATEVNNSLALNFTLQSAPSADLSVLQITTNPTSPTRGDLVHINAVVQNTGLAGTAVTKLAFFHGTNLIGEVDVPALAPGANVTVGIDWNTSAVGSLSTLVVAEADSLNAVAEPDETNNRLQVTVTFQRPGAPSITMTGLTVEPTEVIEGQRVNITVAVRNNGTADGAGSIVVRIDGAAVATFNFTLAPGEVGSYIARWNATTSGAHPVRAELSVSGAVIEQRLSTVNVAFVDSVPPPNYGIYVAVAAIVIFLGIFLFLRRPRGPAGESAESKEDVPAGESKSAAAKPETKEEAPTDEPKSIDNAPEEKE